jgi:hypothetical protein
MAILTDIFVSSPNEAAKYDGINHGAVIELVQFKGLTNLEFGTLWAIIEGKEFDFDQHALESLTPAEETWLLRFPISFVQELVALTPPRIREIAESWANTDELQWESSEAEEVVVELVRLAKFASATSQGLFLWGSV